MGQVFEMSLLATCKDVYERQADIWSLTAPNAHIQCMEKKLVFETEEQRQEAVSEYSLDPSETAVLGDNYHRISRPEDVTNPSTYIFWTMDSPTDKEPMDKKVVCIFHLSRLLQRVLQSNYSA